MGLGIVVTVLSAVFFQKRIIYIPGQTGCLYACNYALYFRFHIWHFLP